MKLEFRKEDLDNTIYADTKYFEDTAVALKKALLRFRMDFWDRMTDKLEEVAGKEFESWHFDIEGDKVVFLADAETQKQEDVEALLGKMADAMIGILPVAEQTEAMTEYFETVDCTACNKDGHCAIQEMAKIRGIDYQKIQNREGVTK